MNLTCRTYISLTVAAFFSFVFSGAALAQTETAVAETPTEEVSLVVEEPVEVEAPDAFDDGERSEEAERDEVVTEADLGVEEATILPDNKVLYGFKRFGRGLKRAFTFDKEKKAELEIEHANQELVDLKRLHDIRGDEAADVVIDGMRRVEDRIENVVRRAPDLGTEVVEELLDSEIKRQKVLEQLRHSSEDERVLERVQEVREQLVEHVGDVFEDVSVDEDLFDRVLERQEGSEFKDLRNLEVLKRIEEHVPEEYRQGIHRAEERAFERVRRHADRPEFGEYLEDFRGDHVVRYDMLDEFVSHFPEEQLPETIREKVKRARDLSARAYQHEFEGLDDRVHDEERRHRMREHMLRRFRVEKEEHIGEEVVDDMSERLERMAEFRSHIQLEELEEELHRVEKEEINAFVEAFPDAREDAETALRTMEDIRRAAADGDFEKVKMLEKIMNELEQKQFEHPDRKEWMLRNFKDVHGDAKREFAEDFKERIELEGDRAYDEFISDDPEQLEFIRRFRDEAREFGGPEGFDPAVFDRALAEQFEHFGEEERRRADQLHKDEFEFRRRADEERESIRREFEERLRKASPEEQNRLHEQWREKEDAFRERHDAQELDIFRRQWEIECGTDAQCLEGRKSEYNKKQAFFEEQRRAEEELREVERELHEFAEEKRREQHEEDLKKDLGILEGRCDDIDGCRDYCEHNDDPLCDQVGAPREDERPGGEFGAVDPFYELRTPEDEREFRKEFEREEHREFEHEFDEFIPDEPYDREAFRFEERHEERVEERFEEFDAPVEHYEEHRTEFREEFRYEERDDRVEFRYEERFKDEDGNEHREEVRFREEHRPEHDPEPYRFEDDREVREVRELLPPPDKHEEDRFRDLPRHEEGRDEFFREDFREEFKEEHRPEPKHEPKDDYDFEHERREREFYKEKEDDFDFEHERREREREREDERDRHEDGPGPTEHVAPPPEHHDSPGPTEHVAPPSSDNGGSAPGPTEHAGPQ